MEVSEFVLEGFDVTAMWGDFEFPAFRHDLHFDDQGGPGDAGGGGGLAGGYGERDDAGSGAPEFLFDGFDEGDAASGFVDDEDAGAALEEFHDHGFEALDGLIVGRAEGEAFGLADDVAGAEFGAAEHVGELGFLVKAFEGDEGGVGAALAEVDAEEADGVDGGDVGDGD